MSAKPEKPRRKPRMVLPPTAHSHFALQRRWQGSAYCDEERFSDPQEAFDAFMRAIRRTPKHDWRVREHHTVAEYQPGGTFYVFGATPDDYVKLRDLVEITPSLETSH